MAAAAADGVVFGHYIHSQDGSWKPVLSESSELFKAIVSDAISQVEEEFEPARLNSFYTLLYWGSSQVEKGDTKDASTNVSVKHRTLVMLAAFHGSLRVLSFLLSKGCDPGVQAPDGLNAYDFATSGGSPNGSTIIAMLKDAASNFTLPSNGPAKLDPVVAPPSHRVSFTEVATSERVSHSSIASFNLPLDVPLRREGEQDLFNSGTNTADAAPYSTAELTRPEYSTDTFRMFCFKVLRCSKRYAHDWRACPFAHPTENARRRDPREFQYCALACPDYKQGLCIRGDACPYSHGVFEAWLHPSKYRTQLCKDGNSCNRPVCFFAHGMAELRAPTFNFVPGTEEVVSAQLPPGANPSCVFVPPAAQPASVPGVQPLAASAAAQVSASASQQDLFAAGYAAAQAAAQEGSSSGVLPDVGGAGVSSDMGNMPKPRASDSSVVSQDVGPSDQVSSQVSAAAAAAAAMAAQPAAVQGAAQAAALVPGAASPAAGPYPVYPPAPAPAGPPAAMGIPAPRMSNAFARKHGLDPRDDPMVTLQKIAYQSQVGLLSINSPREGGRGKQRKGQQGRFRHGHGGPQQQQQQQFLQPPPQQPYSQLPRYGHPAQQQMQPFLGQPQAQHYLPPQQQFQQQQFMQQFQQQQMMQGQMPPPPYPGAYNTFNTQAAGPADPSTLAALTQQFAQMGFAGAPGAQYPMSPMLQPFMPMNPQGQ